MTWTKLGASFDGDVSIGWWWEDGRTIYFTDGVKATNQLLALDAVRNTVRQLTNDQASLFASRDETSGKLLVTYTDPKTPVTHFVLDKVDDIATRTSWR